MVLTCNQYAMRLSQSYIRELLNIVNYIYNNKYTYIYFLMLCDQFVSGWNTFFQKNNRYVSAKFINDTNYLYSLVDINKT